MKTIPLTKGYFTKVDDDDYEKFSAYRWYAAPDSRNNKDVRALRAMRISKNKRRTVALSRFILNAPDGMCVDHINHDTLDNRKSNLRLCLPSENSRNRKKAKNNTTGFKGLVWDNQRKKWKAVVYITIKGKEKHFTAGRFNTKEEAAKAYDKKAKELYGDFAIFNFPIKK